jgi:hypothetical protein
MTRTTPWMICGSTRVVFLIGPLAFKLALPAKGAFAAGVEANLRERRVYRKHSALPLVPTYATLWGLLNVQRRGLPVSRDELEEENPFMDILSPEVWMFNLDDEYQYVRIKRRPLLADYGEKPIEDYFDAWAKESQKAEEPGA